MSLPLNWIDEIFSRMMVRYGRPFMSRWEGLDIDLVKADWANELAGFANQPESIAYGLKNLPEGKPPTATEFRAICRRAPPKPVQALPHKLTPEEQAKASEAVKQVAKQIIGVRDPHAWAKRPGSVLAFNEVLKLAEKGDTVFAGYLAELRSSGHVVGNQLKNRWDGGQWVRA